jgi:hypothetical protein
VLGAGESEGRERGGGRAAGWVGSRPARRAPKPASSASFSFWAARVRTRSGARAARGAARGPAGAPRAAASGRWGAWSACISPPPQSGLVGGSGSVCGVSAPACRVT